MEDVTYILFFKVFFLTVLTVLVNSLQDGKPFKVWTVAIITVIFYMIVV